MFELLRETWKYIRTSKRWWLLPVILVMVLLAFAVVVLEGASFLYPLF